MPTTPVQALPYPALSDPANGPVALQNLALALEDYKTLVRCTSGTRPAHVEGRVIYETDTDILAVSNGTAWQPLGMGAWKTYTPTLTSGTLGTGGAMSGRWVRFGNTVHFAAKVTWGTGFVFNSNTIISTPTQVNTGVSNHAAHLRVTFSDANVNTLFAYGIYWSGGVSCFFHAVTGSVAGWLGAVSPTAPFTWAAGDEVLMAGTYETA